MQMDEQGETAGTYRPERCDWNLDYRKNPTKGFCCSLQLACESVISIAAQGTLRMGTAVLFDGWKSLERLTLVDCWNGWHHFISGTFLIFYLSCDCIWMYVSF